MFPLHLLPAGASLTLTVDNAAGHGQQELHKKQSRTLNRSHSATDLASEESRPNFPPKLVRSNSMPPSRRKRADRWASSSKLNNRWESNCAEASSVNAPSSPIKKLGGDAPPVLPRGRDGPPALPRGDRNARMPLRNSYNASPPRVAICCSRAA